MGIAYTTTDVSGRMQDISILKFPVQYASNGQLVVDALEFGTPSQFCVGIQKLIQRYVITLLTFLGSQTDYPTFGTGLLPYITSTNYGSSKDNVQHAFNFANSAVLSIFRTYQASNPNLPLDEQINTAILNDITLISDAINLKISIISNAGTNVVFYIPLPQLN